MAQTDEFWLFGYGSLIWKPPPHFDRRIPGYVEGYVRRFWQGTGPTLSSRKRGVRAELQLVGTHTLCFQAGSPSIVRFGASNVEPPHMPFPVKPLILLHDAYLAILTNLKASEDHRGTPEAPGRVVTLIERSFWGSLNDQYTIPEERVWGTAYRIEPSKVKEVQEYLDIREINGYSIQFADFHPADGSDSTFKCMVYIGMPDNPQFVGVQEPQALAHHILTSRGPSGENKEYLYMLEQALEHLSHESGDAHITDLACRVHALEAASAGSSNEKA